MLPNKMRAAVVHEFGKPLVIEEVDVPRPGPGEVLIKVVTSGAESGNVFWSVSPEGNGTGLAVRGWTRSRNQSERRSPTSGTNHGDSLGRVHRYIRGGSGSPQIKLDSGYNNRDPSGWTIG